MYGLGYFVKVSATLDRTVQSSGVCGINDTC